MVFLDVASSHKLLTRTINSTSIFFDVFLVLVINLLAVTVLGAMFRKKNILEYEINIWHVGQLINNWYGIMN